jgi:hypothetical protein
MRELNKQEVAAIGGGEMQGPGGEGCTEPRQTDGWTFHVLPLTPLLLQ